MNDMIFHLKIKLIMTSSFVFVELVFDPVPTLGGPLFHLLGRRLCLLLGYHRRVFKSVWQRGRLAQPSRLPWRLPRLVGFVAPRVLVHGHMYLPFFETSRKDRWLRSSLSGKQKDVLFWANLFFFFFPFPNLIVARLLLFILEVI